MKNWLAGFFIIGLWEISIAQADPVIDSLKNLVNSAANDTSKVAALIDLGNSLADRSLTADAYTAYEQALELSEKLLYKRGMARANYSIAVLKVEEGDFAASIRFDSIALQIANEIGDPKILMRINNKLGLAYDYAGNYPLALRHYHASLKIAEEIGDQFGIGAANQNLGCVYMYWNDAESSLKHNMAALKAWKAIDNKWYMADTYTNIGEAYANLCNDEEAERYTRLGVDLAKEIGQDNALAAGLTKLGLIAFMREQHHEALKHYIAALTIWEKLGDEVKIANTMNMIGAGYINLNNLPKAIENYRKAAEIEKKTGNNLDLADSYIALSRAFQSTGKYQLALEYYQQYISIRDELFRQENVQQIASLKEQFESERKDKEIELLSKEKTIQELALRKQKLTKNFFIAGLALFGILSFFIYKNYQNKQNVRVLALRNKIASDLHDDVGSTLSSISMFSQIAQSQSKEALPALETIGESSRKMLDAMNDIVWTINPENDQFEKIIMRMRSFAYELLGAKKIDFEFKVDEHVADFKLPMQTRKNLYLIFKESTNNLAKYADADQAMFSIKSHNNLLTMMIRDNGKGFNPAGEFHGNGLNNIKKRAAEIGALLKIDSAPGNGTTIQLELAVSG